MTAAIGKTIFVDAAAANDAGNGTPAKPKKILASGMAMMSAMGGDTLILASGTYSAPGDAITRFVRVPNGKPGAYNVIKAAVDGGVTLTGEFSLPLTSEYLQFEGLKWDSANSKALAGHHLKFLRCAFKGAPSEGNVATLTIGTNDHTPGAQHVLIEDSWVYGPGGRYKILVYNAEFVVMRRVFVRHDAGWKYDDRNPQGGVTIYNSKDVHLQNSLVIDSDLDYPGWGAGIYIVKNNDRTLLPVHSGTRVTGSIVLNVKGSAIGFDGLGRVVDARIQDSVIWDATNGLFLNNGDHAVSVGGLTVGKLTKGAFGVYAGPGATLDVQHTIVVNTDFAFAGENGRGTIARKYNNCNANRNGRCNAIGETTYSPFSSGLKYLPRIEEKTPLKNGGEGGRQVGAQIVNRIGANGSMFGEAGFDAQTSESLWPWPNEARLWSDVCAGVTRGFCGKNLSLTEYIWNYLAPEGSIVRPYANSSRAPDEKKVTTR